MGGLGRRRGRRSLAPELLAGGARPIPAALGKAAPDEERRDQPERDVSGGGGEFADRGATRVEMAA